MSLETRTMSAVVSQFHLPRGPLGRVAGWVMGHRGSNVERNRWAVSLLDIQPGDVVLELGFGPGVAVAEAARRATQGRVYGLDPSEVMVRQAVRRNAEAVRQGRVDLRVGTVEDLALFDGARFDAVLTVNSFGFWPEQRAALASMHRAMRPTGRIALVTQPRGARATEADAVAAGDEYGDLLSDAEFSEVRVEMLGLRPVPVAAALGVRR